MTVIFQGWRYAVPDHDPRDGAWLELTIGGHPANLPLVRIDDPDLIVAPTAEDLQLAEAFERGEVSAFEYADGHTFPPHCEITQSPQRARAPHSSIPQ
jgi:hypothetical protein